MEKNNKLGLFIFLGLLCIAISTPFAVSRFTDAGRSVSVKGLCEKEVLATRAIWPIVYKEGGNSIAELAANTEKKNGIIIEWLKAAGFSEKEISVSAPKIENLKANGYSQNNVYDYVMTSVITVCTDQVEKVVEYQAKQLSLVSKGIAVSGDSWEYTTSFEFTKLNDIKPEMIEQATKNARLAAEKFAKDSGSRVGKIISASQGQVSISDRDSNTPYVKTVRVVTSINYQLR